MDGLSTREIAEELGKSDENIRQHLKNSRDRLKLHPEIAPLAPRQSSGPEPGPAGSEIDGHDAGAEEGGGPVNDYGKPQNDMAQADEQAHEADQTTEPLGGRRPPYHSRARRTAVP